VGHHAAHAPRSDYQYFCHIALLHLFISSFQLIPAPRPVAKLTGCGERCKSLGKGAGYHLTAAQNRLDISDKNCDIVQPLFFERHLLLGEAIKGRLLVPPSFPMLNTAYHSTL
jgi:hypothetical protein